MARHGSPRATTSSRATAFRPPSSRCAVTPSSPNSTFGLPIYRWRPQAEHFRRDRRLAAREHRRRARKPPLRLCARQGAAAARACRSRAWADRLSRRGRGDQRALSRGRHRPAADASRDADREQARFRPRPHSRPAVRRRKPWLKRFGDYSDALASGWMQVRGNRRRRGLDRGFALSDHADWPGLIAAIKATGAERILVTHGYTEPLTRYLAREGSSTRARSRPLTATTRTRAASKRQRKARAAQAEGEA